MHECPKTHFKHKCMHASHHATSSCHVAMPHHHAMSSCHIIMPCQHATSSCHIVMIHYHAMSPCHITMPCHHVCLVQTPCVTLSVPRGTSFCQISCWPYRTKRDNFLIRRLFEVKRMLLESSRWDLRPGASFAKIGGLQKNFLLGSSWIIPPHWEAFGLQKPLLINR